MINKFQSNKANILLANTVGQPLKEHSIAIALYGHLLLKSFKFKPEIEKEINKYLIYSALLHDLGKVSSGFQDYIKKTRNKNLENTPMDAEASRPKKFEGPFHNEISWAYISNFIDFKSSNIKSIVRHSVYWHHSANWSQDNDKIRFENSRAIFENLEKIKENKSKLLSDIFLFTGELLKSFFNDYYKDDLLKIELKEPEENDIEEIQYPRFFDHKIKQTSDHAKKQLCLNLLLESDRTISSWSPKELKDFLQRFQESKDCKIPCKKTENFNISKDSCHNTQQSKEQYQLAQKMTKEQLSVCGVDPAGGKTSVSLYWWQESNNEHPLMIALPRQNQVTGLFQSVKEDCQRIYGEEHKIKMEAVFNGKRQQHYNWNPKEEDQLLISDINILVFDRFLSPYYKRNQSSEFLKMLKSHLILDEFHEFKNLSKMIPSLQEILTIRSWLDSGVKTLMLSGTIELSLLKLLNVGQRSIFQRTELSPRNNHKFKIHLLDENFKEEDQKFVTDCLFSYLRVESCQKVFSKFFKEAKDKIKMIHSYFTVVDKKELLEQILKEHGKKESATTDKSVITSKMLQSSYNLNFNKAVVELSQPYMDCQTAGRINRFGNKPEAEIYFIYNEKTESYFKESSAGFQEIHKRWKEHILSFIKNRLGKIISIRELMESYDSFWSNENNIKESFSILEKKQEKAIKELNEYVPKRFFPTKKAKSSVLNSLFRGESRYLSACIVNDNGDSIDQLHDEDLLNESRHYVINEIQKAMESCLKGATKRKEANKNKDDEEIFEYTKYMKKFGYKIEAPLLCSHINKTIDQCLTKALYDEDKQSTYHKVYHKKFGLVNKRIIKHE